MDEADEGDVDSSSEESPSRTIGSRSSHRHLSGWGLRGTDSDGDRGTATAAGLQVAAADGRGRWRHARRTWTCDVASRRVHVDGAVI